MNVHQNLMQETVSLSISTGTIACLVSLCAVIVDLKTILLFFFSFLFLFGPYPVFKKPNALSL